MDIATKMKFRDVCDVLESIQKAPDIAKKEKYFRRLYNSFGKFRETFRENNGLTGPETGNTCFYGVLRCLLPNADTARKAYGLQKPTVGRVYIKVLNLSADSRPAQILKNGNYFGDYAEVVYQVLDGRCRREASNLSMHEIHEMLDSIAEEDIRNTEMILTNLTNICSALEQKWFVRLLLKSMNLGIGEHRIFAVLHPQAKGVYQRCSSLQRLCCFIADHPAGLHSAIEAPSDLGTVGENLNDIIEPFQPIQPMLCERFAGDVQPLMADDVLYLETKMDGERFQLHYANGHFEYFSRNGNNYTSSFGADYGNGPLTPQLQSLLPPDMDSLILDGEMMVWDSFVKEFRQKGENTDVKHLSAHRNWWPCFVVYDILYLNGRSLLELPYIERTHKMRQLIKEKTGVLQLMRPQKIRSLDMFKEQFQKALDHDEEGVVVKKENSAYLPGTRGQGWYKVKSDYIDGMTTDFDLLVIGGFYNLNRNYVNSFLLGVLKGDSQKFEVFSVGKVGNRSRQRLVLNSELKKHWHDVKNDPPPSWYHYVDSNADGRPDVWIDPRHSVILQCKAADLAPSSSFVLSKSLHFPRVQEWRNDKLWHDCMSWQEYTDIIQQKTSGIKKIHKRPVTLDDLQTQAKQRRPTTAQQHKNAAQKYKKTVETSEITITSDIFNGFSICVLSGSLASNVTQQHVKSLVIANGGEIVEYPLHGAKCFAIAGDITGFVKSIKNTHNYNIVTLSWFRRCCDEQKRLQLRPRDFIYFTKDLKEQFDERYDSCGDSYTIPVTIEELETLIDDISEEMLNGLSVNDEEIAALEEKVFAKIRSDFYRKTCGYFYTKDEMSQCTYQWLGGVCLTFEQALRFPGVLYVFIDITCKSFVKSDFKAWIAKYFPKKLTTLKIVDAKWITDSCRAKNLLDVNEYAWLQ